MNRVNRIIGSVFTIFLIFILTSCGTDNSGITTVNEPEQQEDKSVTTKIEVEEDGNAKFTIKNETDEEVTLTYPNGQDLEYQLLDNEKNTVFTYSANKVFVLMISEKVLKPSEEIVIPLDLKTELAEVSAGSYTLVAWATAEELSEQKQEIAYEWAGHEGENVVPSDTTETLVVFKGDENAENVVPYEATFEFSEDLFHQIFEEIMELDVELIDYRIENDNKKLVLNMKGLDNVQGSAGENIFIGTIVHSYFENFPDLEEIYFEEEGKTPVELAHTVVSEPFTRDQNYTNKK